MAILVVLTAMVAVIFISGLIITGVWNWTVVYLAWSLFKYNLPRMNVWQGICVYFVLAVICAVLNAKTDDKN